MKRKFFAILICSLLVFSATAEDAQRGNDSGEKIIGVDNFIFSSDSSDLINSNLIDFQVEYDIAYAQKDFTGVAKALHKISLVYYHLNKLDLASTYAWRSKNVSNKHNLNKEELNAFAILFRINERQGNDVVANQLKEKYYSKLEEIAIDPVISNYAFSEPAVSEVVKPVVVEETREIPALIVPIATKSEEQNEANLISPLLIGMGLGLLALVILGFSFWVLKRRKSKELKNKAEAKSEIASPSKRVKELKVEPKKVTPVHLTSPVNGEKKVSKNIRVPGKDGVEAKVVSSKPVIVEPDVRVKAPIINRETRNQATPLWISAIEHHIKDVKVVSGVSVSFIYAGKMDSVSEKLQDALTVCIKNGVGALVKDTAVLNISVQLVRSNENIIGSIFARPVSTARQSIQTDVISMLTDSISKYKNIQINGRVLDNGSLKLVMKSELSQKHIIN